jgi:hypothetical protein
LGGNTAGDRLEAEANGGGGVVPTNTRLAARLNSPRK